LVLISEIAKRINGIVEGDPNLEISGVCDIKNGQKGKITFLGNLKYLPYFETTDSTAIIVKSNQIFENSDKTLIRVQNPHLGFAKTLEIFQKTPQTLVKIHPTAIFNKTVKIGKNVSVGANVTIGDYTTIGDNSVIKPNVIIYDYSQIGKNVTIDSGTVIGADGFGWVTDNDNHYKIPHIGNVIINDNAWIGANCTIDRGTFNSTIIGEFCKLDNQIHIAHNVKLGLNCLIAGQTGIAGSTTIGNNVTIAGQCGIADNLNIADNCIIAAKSAVLQSLPKNSFVSGNPARNHKDRIKQEIIIQQLPELLKRIRGLEKNLNETKR
jgi:UDP-3-O-[3-hydroxymyristoyl] glucosamine N-acyltransferase